MMRSSEITTETSYELMNALNSIPLHAMDKLYSLLQEIRSYTDCVSLPYREQYGQKFIYFTKSG